jgi:replicative DNA helicase
MTTDPFGRAMPGGRAILDEPEGIPAVWGTGTSVAWSEGEPLLLVGPPGVGKTTLGQQLVLARIGVRPADVLGLPVARDLRPVLYIAADRPRQATRSMRRMVTENDRDRLDAGLIVWPGPLPFHLPTEPERLARMAAHYGAGTVVLDSLKDIAPGLEKPEVGTALSVALQHLVAEGVEVIGNHHQRKPSSDNRRPNALADVYGSAWITAGAGSVLLLWGDAGDPVVEVTHLKQPADPVGPWQVVHDHDTGTSTALDRPDPLAILTASPRGVTARTLAQTMTGKAEPSRADVERARRHLDRLTGRGLATKRGPDEAKHLPALYLPAAREAAA